MTKRGQFQSVVPCHIEEQYPDHCGNKRCEDIILHFIFANVLNKNEIERERPLHF